MEKFAILGENFPDQEVGDLTLAAKKLSNLYQKILARIHH